MKKVSIAKDFTRFPSGRYMANGSTSGEAFRKKFLEEPVSNREEVQIDFDGTIGYGSSFLEEAFGGVVRELKINSKDILALLKFSSSDPSIIQEVISYINDASDKLKK